MSLILNESLVLAKTRSQDLKSVLRLNCWGSGIKDVSLVRELVNVEVIGLSCNEVSTLRDFAECKKLRELILRKNNIKNISEIAHLQGLPKLTNLWLDENPCVETTHNYRKIIIKALPQLKVLDNKPITQDELREIDELGDEIYEEVPYESTGSTGSSGPSSGVAQKNDSHNQQQQQQQQAHHDEVAQQEQSHLQELANSNELDEASFFTPNHMVHESTQLNDTVTSVNHMYIGHEPNPSRGMHTSRVQPIHPTNRCISSQGSMNALNGSGLQGQAWVQTNHNNISNSNNNNNCLLPKGGKSRSGNILSAVLCLVKELDYTSCEVVQTALHCRMEETSQ